MRIKLLPPLHPLDPSNKDSSVIMAQAVLVWPLLWQHGSSLREALWRLRKVMPHSLRRPTHAVRQCIRSSTLT